MRDFTNKGLISIFILALLLRAAYIMTLDNSSVGPPDSSNYDELAMNLKSGQGLQAEGFFGEEWYSFRAPLFPIFLASVYTIFGHSYLAARLVLALVSALTCIIIYRIGDKTFNPKVGMVAAAGMAIYPKFIYYSGFLIPETLYILLLAVTILFLLKARDGWNLSDLAWGGIFFGLTSLTKPTILFFLLFIFIWMMTVSQSKKEATRSFLVTILFVALTMSPWAVRNHLIHREIVFTTYEGGYNFWLAHNPSTLARERGLIEKEHSYLPEDESTFKNLSEADKNRLFIEQALFFIKERPFEFLESLGIQFINFWRLYPRIQYVERKYVIIGLFSFGPLLLLSLLGMVVSRKEREKVLLFYLLFIYYTAIHMLFAVVTRYRVPIVPYLIIFAAYALIWLGKKGKE